MTWKCQRMPNGSLSIEVNQLAAASVSTEKFNLGLPGKKKTPAVSVRGGPTQARLVPNSLLPKPLANGAQVVIGKKRAREREFSFLFPPSLPLLPPCVLRRGLGTIQPLGYTIIACVQMPSPHSPQKKSLFPIFFWWVGGGGGGGDLYTGYTITIVYNVFRCGLMYHSTPNL